MQRQKILDAIREKVKLGLFLAEQDRSEKGFPSIKWAQATTLCCIWGNVLVFLCEDRKGDLACAIPLTLNQIPLAALWRTETHSLTALWKHGFITLDQIRNESRETLRQMPGVGKEGMKELDRIMKYSGLNYKECSGNLFPDDLPSITVQ